MMTLNASGSTALSRCPPDSGDTYVEDSLVPGNVQPSHTVNIDETFLRLLPLRRVTRYEKEATTVTRSSQFKK